MTDRRDTLQGLCRTVDRAATPDIADLIDEARLEAKTKVRSALADAFAESLFDLAEAELQRRRSALAPPPSRSEAHGSRRRNAASRGGREVSVGGGEDDAERGEDDAERGKDAHPQAAAAGSSARQREPQGLGCYVYGIVGAQADLVPDLIGLDDVHEVFLIHGESVAAVASLVALDEFGEEALQERLEDLSWLERRARRHEQILDRVRAQTTLVPMRLCTIYRDERSVREMLAREHAFLADALHRLEGRTEWGVKMYSVSDPGEAIAGDADEDDAPSQAPGPGASYLMEKQRQDGRRERTQALIEERCELAHSGLVRAAVEAKLNPVQPQELTGRDEPMVFNGVYLVDDARLDNFTSVLRALEPELAEDGLELELTGPWTPYNFVNSPTEVGR
jgi:hypothetical protein